MSNAFNVLCLQLIKQLSAVLPDICRKACPFEISKKIRLFPKQMSYIRKKLSKYEKNLLIMIWEKTYLEALVSSEHLFPKNVWVHESANSSIEGVSAPSKKRIPYSTSKGEPSLFAVAGLPIRW